jgi:hypothetical protein
MKFAGKTLTEYFIVSKKFLVIAFILIGISVIWRLCYVYPAGIQTIVTILGVIVIGWAGWTMVRVHGFSLKQTGFVGFLFVVITFWTLPIFHKIGEVFLLFIINTFLYILITILGGWLAKKIK